VREGLQSKQDQASGFFWTEEEIAWKSASLILIVLVYIIKAIRNSDLNKFICGPKHFVFFYCLKNPSGISGNRNITPES